MSATLTRGDLYELVWSEPLRKLSTRFGVSDVALAKRCRAANIPLPGIGYWNKKEAGKPVVQVRLPPRGLGQCDCVEIGRQERSSYADEEQELLRETLIPPAPFPDGFPEVLARARQVVGEVRLKHSLANPHPLVARLLHEDDKRREKQEASPYPSSFDAPIFQSPFERRRLRFMNSLLLAIARAGGRASLRGREALELGVTIGDQHLGFTLGPLKEPATTYPPRQLAANEKMKLKLGWYEPPPEVKVLWADSEKEKLEDQIQEIAVNLMAYAEWAYRHGIQRRYEWRVERKRELEERIRKEREEEARKERERIERAAAERRRKLIADAAAWRSASDIRTYVDAQVAKWGSTSDRETLARLGVWANWARAEADRLDPLSAAPLV